MTCLASVSVTALFVSMSGCLALLTPPAQPAQQPQPAQLAQAAPKAKSVHISPKPEPTQEELFDYIRGKLIALSPGDGINDNQEISFDPANSVLSITQPDGRCDIFLSAIDSNSAMWEAYDPSDTYHTREQVLRLTLTSLSGKKARTCYDSHNEVDRRLSPNRARLVFSLDKANAVPNFTNSMGKAIKKLVVLAGGTPEKDIFEASKRSASTP